MSRFYVGQRVRIVGTNKPVMAAHFGKEGVIVSACPVYPASWDVSGALFAADGVQCSWAEASLEPILYDGNQLVQWSECLWQPEGQAA